MTTDLTRGFDLSLAKTVTDSFGIEECELKDDQRLWIGDTYSIEVTESLWVNYNVISCRADGTVIFHDDFKTFGEALTAAVGLYLRDRVDLFVNSLTGDSEDLEHEGIRDRMAQEFGYLLAKYSKYSALDNDLHCIYADICAILNSLNIAGTVPRNLLDQVIRAYAIYSGSPNDLSTFYDDLIEVRNRLGSC